MANAIFPKGREGFANGDIDWSTAVIKVSLIRGYTYDSTDEFMSDVLSTGTLASTQTLASKTATNGTCDAADVTFTAVTANASNHNLIVYQASAVTGGADVATSAQRVIAHYDTGTNLPVVPNGGDVTVTWSSGADKMFTL
jgi:hypothetical protein